MQMVILFALLTVLPLADGGTYCGSEYCYDDSDCCCYSSVRGNYCCSCSGLAGWAIAVIVIGIILVIALAVGLGVWRRRVYLATRQTTVYTQSGGVPVHTVTQYAY